jgi:prolipoprotein diacylglyceryl transferase
MQKIIKKEHIKVEVLDGMTTAALIGVIAGARLGHCLFYGPWFDQKNLMGQVVEEGYISHPLNILKIWEGGLASHGATLGVLIAFYIFSRRYKLDYLWVLSRAAIVVPVSAGLIRLGNLMNSEIYGHVTTMPWGFYFVKSTDVMYGIERLEPHHPTQIYEALAYFIIFAILLLYYIRKSKTNSVRNEILIGLVLTLVFTFRFFIEFLKNEQVDFEHSMPINMGQILSIPFVLVGAYFLWRGTRPMKEISEKA